MFVSGTSEVVRKCRGVRFDAGELTGWTLLCILLVALALLRGSGTLRRLVSYAKSCQNIPTTYVSHFRITGVEQQRKTPESVESVERLVGGDGSWH